MFCLNTKEIGGEYIFTCNFKVNYINIKINYFWRNVLFSWSYYKYYNPVKYKDILNQSLWNNSFIRVGGKTAFFKEWYNVNILYVKHVTKENGMFKSFDELQEEFNVPKKCYSEYISLISCMRKEWKTCLKDHRDEENVDDGLKKFLCVKKVTKYCYKEFVKKVCLNVSTTNQYEKWYNDLNIDIDLNSLMQWQSRFETIYWVTLDTKIRMFQYKFIHRRIATNDYLFKIGVKISPICNFCNGESQTLIHLFYSCPNTKSFWNDVNMLLTEKRSSTTN